MKNATDSIPTLPASHRTRPARSFTTPDWRAAFRLGALDLNPDMRSTFEPVSLESPPDVPSASRWILEDRLLSRMIAALQTDAQALGEWQQRCGAAPAACNPRALIRELGFEHTPLPAGVVDQLLFMVRFTVACVALSTRCIFQAAAIEQTFRRRPT